MALKTGGLWRVTATAGAALIVQSGPSAAAELACSEWRALDQRSALVALAGVEDSEGIEHIRSEDVDRDGRPDEIEWSCPNGGSLIPSDPCTLTIQLTRSHSALQLEEERLILFKRNDALYVRTSVLEPAENPTAMRRAIYRVGASELELVCDGYLIPL